MKPAWPYLAIGVACLCMIPAFSADDYQPVKVELQGETSTWVETDPVFETTDDAVFQSERYGERFAYRLSGLPPGLARLKLGFCEFKYTEPGKRVFSVLANGEPVLEDFDILRQAGPREALVRTAMVRVPEDGVMTLEFVGILENAKINFLKLYTNEWKVEVNAADGPTVELGQAVKDAPYMDGTYETCIGKFGSRLCINPRPQKGICRQTPLGHADYNVAYFERNHALYEDAPTAVYYAVSCGDKWASLPFNGRLPAFTQIRQEQTLTSLRYTCRAPEIPLEVTYSFHAPFYPEDVKLSVAPYILLDVTVRNLQPVPHQGSVVIGQSLRPQDVSRPAGREGLLGVEMDAPVFGKQTTQAWLVDERDAGDVTAHAASLAIPAMEGSETAAAASTDSDGRTVLATSWADAACGLSWSFSLEPRASATKTFAYVGWAPEPIIEVRSTPYHFKYVDLFLDLYDVARYAFDKRQEIDEKVALFESTVYDASGPQELKDFLAFAFQSWIQNTFYCADVEGTDWFSVWEGCCKFHSTVDVEYNVAPLYFEYWPELMRMTLEQWPHYIRNGVLSHDMGMGLAANGMDYPHEMEVEENTNFVLLLHRYWLRTGDSEFVGRMYEHVRVLLDHVIASDTDGDGFHEEGTYNTIDQGSAAVQYAKDQVYLAVRALAAFECGAHMADLVTEPEDARRYRAQVDLIANTLDSRGWKDDHYVVSLEQRAEGYADAPRQGQMGGYDGPGQWDDPIGGARGNWNTGGGYGRSSASSSVAGWDAYSIYATNGLLYPMQSGFRLPGLDMARMKRDLETSTRATLKRFGSPHTSNESNMWVSQNIWRDMAAAYLGMDYLDNVSRYWNLQKYINTTKRGCFTDVYVYGGDSISLDYYPRGVAAFGMLSATAGLQVDKITGRVSIAPVRTPLRIPLLAYADWAKGEVPWLDIVAEKDSVGVAVGEELPVEVRVRKPGEPW